MPHKRNTSFAGALNTAPAKPAGPPRPPSLPRAAPRAKHNTPNTASRASPARPHHTPGTRAHQKKAAVAAPAAHRPVSTNTPMLLSEKPSRTPAALSSPWAHSAPARQHSAQAAALSTAAASKVRPSGSMKYQNPFSHRGTAAHIFAPRSARRLFFLNIMYFRGPVNCACPHTAAKRLHIHAETPFPRKKRPRYLFTFAPCFVIIITSAMQRRSPALCKTPPGGLRCSRPQNEGRGRCRAGGSRAGADACFCSIQ